MSESLQQVLAEGLQGLGLPADEAVLQRLQQWLELHRRWAPRVNLTGTRDPLELVQRHLLDAAALVPHLPDGRLLDVGSGAGLPGLVIAALQPERPMVLLDALQRRTTFLEQAVIELRLQQVQVVTARCEQWHSVLPLAAVVARAVAPLPRLLAFTGHLLSSSTPLLAVKGPGWREELATLGDQWQVLDAIPYLPTDWERGHVLVRVIPKEAV